MSDDTETQQGEDSPVIKQLRDQLKKVTAERDGLREFQQSTVFEKAGVPEKARGLFAKVYEGDYTPEAVREFAEANGFTFGETTTTDAESAIPSQPTEAQQQRTDVQGRIDALNANSAVATERVSGKELLELHRTDPQRARALFEQGRVDSVAGDLAAHYPHLRQQ